MSIDRLSELEYKDLVAIVDGRYPLNAAPLLDKGLIVEHAKMYKLTGDGRRHYTEYRERSSVGDDSPDQPV